MSMIDLLVDAQASEAGWPKPDREVRVVPSRRFRWDYVWVAQKITLEIDGAIWVKGGHSTGKGIERDMEKANLAAAYGYRCLRLTPRQVKAGGLTMWLRMMSIDALLEAAA